MNGECSASCSTQAGGTMRGRSEPTTASSTSGTISTDVPETASWLGGSSRHCGRR